MLSSFALSWVDKVTTGTLSFVLVIVNVGSWLAIRLSIIKHVADQVKIRLISQLINGISNVLQKVLKYFNGALILTFFVPPFRVLSAIFVLNLSEVLLLFSVEKSAISPLSFINGSSLYYCHKLPDV